MSGRMEVERDVLGRSYTKIVRLEQECERLRGLIDSIRDEITTSGDAAHVAFLFVREDDKALIYKGQGQGLEKALDIINKAQAALEERCS